MNELREKIKQEYNSNWIALSNSNKITQLTELVSNQANHYGDKPQGLWMGLGDAWLQFIEDEDMTDWITEYCSAFKIDLEERRLIILKSVEDYVNFNKKYAKNEDSIRWEDVSKDYDGIIVYNPRSISLKLDMFWLYTWDITSACVWRNDAIEDIEEIYNGCEPKVFRKGGKIKDLQKYLTDKYSELKTLFLFEDDEKISLDMIEIEKEHRKKGIGSNIMNEIINYADANNKEIVLVPALKDDIHKTTSRARLVKFYKRFGFVENKGRNQDFRRKAGSMFRLPKSSFEKGGNVVTWKHKYNKKYGYPKNESHSLEEISKDTGVSMKGLRQIYNKGIGAYKTNPSSVRPNVTSKEQWAMARVYSSVMGGKASKVDAKELKMEKGGILNNPNFKSWFGDSKVVDEKGNPLVVYHGTGGNFDKFKDSIDGGSWFTSNPIVAEDFVFMGNPSIIPVYLSLKNPYIADLKGSFLQDSKEIVETIKDVNEVQSDKYDGIILKNALDYVDNPIVSDIYVSFEPTQIKSAIGNSGEFNPNNPSIIMAEGGQICTYDFDGYDLAKRLCGDNVDVFLVPAEYDRVSIWLFENHFPLWLYYNYLARIVISKEDVFQFQKEFKSKFEITQPNTLWVKDANDKWWKKTPYGQARSYMSFAQFKGMLDELKIVLVANGGWNDKFKERTSGMTIPSPNGVHLNTVIHEYSHLLDVIRFNKEKPNEKILVTHQRGFLIALRDTLMACKKKEIPVVSLADTKALIIQKGFQNKTFLEQFKDKYGMNTFKGTVPKELKEFDERFLDLNDSKLSKEDAQMYIELLNEYQEIELEEMAMYEMKKANRLYKSVDKLLKELKEFA